MRRQPSLRSQLNQIRLWVRQGRTDAWIAHKLDIGVGDLARFKREHQLEVDEATALRPADPLSVEAPEFAAEIEEEEDEEETEEADEEERPRSRSRSSERSGERSGSRGRGSRPPRRREPRAARDDDDAKDQRRESRPADRAATPDDEDGESRPRRRRGRRGGRRHRARRDALEATFDHGEEGYGLWLDPSVVDNPVYSEHWAGHRAVMVTLDADSIVIRRAQAASPGADDELSADEDDE